MRKGKNRFTIFIPTYNRAHTLGRAFLSIESQTFHDFDVVIIDDGSTDNTRQLVQQWGESVNFAVNYFYKENGGKPSAYNYALDKITGYFTVLLDSDDVLASDALEMFEYYWNEIPLECQNQYAGVEGLTALMSNGEVFGSKFPDDRMDGNYLETTKNMGGDRKNAIRSTVMREYPFPEFPGEKDMRESVVYSRMSEKYKLRYVNHIFQYIELSSDGLSSRPLQRRTGSPNGFSLAYKEEINDHYRHFNLQELYSANVKYIRYGLHAKIPLKCLWDNLRRKQLFFLAIPSAYRGYLVDLIKLKKLKVEP